MINKYTCGECGWKIVIDGTNQTNLKCPNKNCDSKMSIKGESLTGTVLADVMKQNGSAIMREFLCQKCNKGPYWPVGAHIQASLCPTCGQRSECSGQCEVFPKSIRVLQ
jgi:DNA-directed RNA polymerase subunit RPC12/RpoP